MLLLNKHCPVKPGDVPEGAWPQQQLQQQQQQQQDQQAQAGAGGAEEDTEAQAPMDIDAQSPPQLLASSIHELKNAGRPQRLARNSVKHAHATEPALGHAGSSSGEGGLPCNKELPGKQPRSTRQPQRMLSGSVPGRAVVAYVWSVVRHIVPAGLLGDRHNRRCAHLHEGIRSSCLWLRPNGWGSILSKLP